MLRRVHRKKHRRQIMHLVIASKKLTRRDATSLDSNQGKQPWVIPAAHMAIVDQLQDLTLREYSARYAEPAVFSLHWLIYTYSRVISTLLTSFSEWTAGIPFKADFKAGVTTYQVFCSATRTKLCFARTQWYIANA